MLTYQLKYDIINIVKQQQLKEQEEEKMCYRIKVKSNKRIEFYYISAYNLEEAKFLALLRFDFGSHLKRRWEMKKAE